MKMNFSNSGFLLYPALPPCLGGLLFLRVSGQSNAFYKMALCLGICECVPKTNMPYLPCLSVTIMIEFIQGHLLCNFFFFFLAWVERYMAHIGKNTEYLVFFSPGCISPATKMSVHEGPWNTAEKCRQKEMATYHKFYYIFFCKYTLYITWMCS